MTDVPWLAIVVVAVVSSLVLLVIQDWFNKYIVQADPFATPYKGR